ncbi:hypothetical protein IWX78_002800 [Mycetocola sp. CAN_C7]|uniref:FUSC family protein n=1 Tax=Mycetocola sp. CAN_C7 TaxID=2787724 RepID=UPI0018CA744D
MDDRGLGRSLVSFAPSARRWPMGVQAGLAMAIPVIVFTLLGNTGLGLQASMGAFTALYCASLSRTDRIRVLPLVGGGFVASAAVGALSSSSPLSLAVGLIVVGLAAIILTQGFRLGPPGPMMFTLVAGAAGVITGPPAFGGAGLDGVTLVLLVAGGSALAYLLVIAPLAVPSVARRHGPATPLRTLFPGLRFDTPTRVVIGRMSAALVLSVGVGALLGAHHGYWITASALAILSVGHSLRAPVIRGVHRVVGTLVGCLAFLLLALWSPAGVILGLVLGLMQLVIEIVVPRHYALALVLITPLALTIGTAAANIDPVDVVGERILDTLLGAAIAALVLVASWLIRRRATDAVG